MRKLLIAAVTGALAFVPLTAEAGYKFKPPVFKHYPKPTIKPPQKPPGKPSHAIGGGNGNTLVGDILAGIASCMLTGHFIDTIRVGEIEKRQRTQEDEQFIIANCILPFAGGYLVREHWKGKPAVPLAHFTQVNWFPHWQK